MRQFLLAVTLACLIYTPALAEGKITTDPNETPATVTENEETTDPRLAQKVTYEAKKKTALVVLNDLGELTGITFKVGKNKEDWQVRDRKMNIFAKDVPLGKLMSSIARTLHCKWSKNDYAKVIIYRLIMDSRAMAEADAARIEYEKRQVERRQKALDSLTKSASLSEQDLAKLKQENPLLYYCAQTGISNSMSALCKESPGVLDALMNGQATDLSAANLSPAAQRSLVGLVTGMNNLEQKFGGPGHSDTSSLSDNMSGATLRINSHIEEMRSSPHGNSFLGMIEISYPNSDGSQGHSGLPLFDPESNFAKAIGKVIAKCDQEGLSIQDVGMEMQSEMGKAMGEDAKANASSEKPIEHPDDPDLTKKLTTESGDVQFEDMLGKLSEGSEFAVVSDSFTRSFNFNRQYKWAKDTELKAALEEIGNIYSCNWEKHGLAIELWDKKWPDKIAAMVPEAWLERWRKNLKENGTLDIGELSEIASLTPEQINQNLRNDNVLMYSAEIARSNREVLRLYAGMSDAQREMLFTQSGLDLRSVGAELWTLVEKTIGSKNAAFLTNPDAQLTVFGKREARNKTFSYSFRVKSSEEQPEITWEFTTPAYTPPEKEAAK